MRYYTTCRQHGRAVKAIDSKSIGVTRVSSNLTAVETFFCVVTREFIESFCGTAVDFFCAHGHGPTSTAPKGGLGLASHAGSDWGPHGISRGGQVHMWVGAAAAFSSKKTLSFPSTAAAGTQNAASTSTCAMGLRALLEGSPSVFRPTNPPGASWRQPCASTGLQRKSKFEAVVKIHSAKN